MNRFIQLHLLTSYPPSNLNRDDLGRPKTAVMGGSQRLRISSQSLKRAWRKSDLFEEALNGHMGVRTKFVGTEAYKALLSKGVAEPKAREWAKSIGSVFGKLKSGKDIKPIEEMEIEQLAHISPEERVAVDQLVEAIAARGEGPSEQERKLLRDRHSAADIALFGRMLASSPKYNVEAAAQVAHAVTVHKVAIEDDFFTAVDDLNTREEDLGAGHMGETEFGAGVFYLYACINQELLRDNLNGDQDLANRALTALIEAAATVSPGGKQNSFASRAYASYILAEKGDQQPRSLSVAFLKPVAGQNMLETAISCLENSMEKMDRVYGPCAEARYVLNAEAGEGGLKELLKFVTG